MPEFEALFYDDPIGLGSSPRYGNYQTAMADWIVHNKGKLTILYASYRKHLITKDDYKGYTDAVYIKYSADAELPTPMECIHETTTTEIIREATCIVPGVKRTYCTNCGVTIGYETIPCIEHVPEDEVVREATCKERGVVNTVCLECGQVLMTKYIDKLPHTPSIKVAIEPTCNHPGLENTVCSECGEMLSHRDLPTIAHKYVDGVCEVCGEHEPK